MGGIWRERRNYWIGEGLTFRKQLAGMGEVYHRELASAFFTSSSRFPLNPRIKLLTFEINNADAFQAQLDP